MGGMGRKYRITTSQVYLQLRHVQEPRRNNLVLSEKVSSCQKESRGNPALGAPAM